MKKLMLFLALTLMSSLVFGQDKQFKKAINNGKDAQSVYVASFDKAFTANEINSWLAQNNYVLVNSTSKEFSKFGSTITGYGTVSFMSRSDYNYAQAEYERQRIAQDKGLGFFDALALIAAAAVIVKGGQAIGEAFTSSGESSSNASSNTYSPVCYDLSTERRWENNTTNIGNYPIYEIKCITNGKLDYNYIWTYYYDRSDGYYYSYSAFTFNLELSKSKTEALNKLCKCSN